MKDWIKKIAEQFEVDADSSKKRKNLSSGENKVSDEVGTIIYLLDVMNKNLIDTPQYPVRKAREEIDELTQQLLTTEASQLEEILFKTRHFFNSYRVDEITHFKHSFEDFKKIIWDFADQLKEELKDQKKLDSQVDSHLKGLRDAVESNSIEVLRKKSKDFIHSYMEVQNKKEMSKEKRISSIKKNLNHFKKKLSEAETSLNTDFLTQAYNRKYFDEQARSFLQLSELTSSNACLLVMDIDFFKKINDQFGHDIGDFVLKECVAILKSIFTRENDLLARMGGEEFAVFLPDYRKDQAIIKAEEVLETVRKQVFVHGNHQIRFTLSIGLAEWNKNEPLDKWYKRADQSLYEAKNTGRNRLVVNEIMIKAS
ncbi:MAG: GGDEF domain-containing protein [Bdellovibrionales bacterium]|nr:GGDEF domain-containing protein [Bdellovibrionales bacterium]